MEVPMTERAFLQFRSVVDSLTTMAKYCLKTAKTSRLTTYVCIGFGELIFTEIIKLNRPEMQTLIVSLTTII